jgi:hypothetical protein
MKKGEMIRDDIYYCISFCFFFIKKKERKKERNK